MVPVELSQTTSVRAIAFGATGNDTLLAAMRSRMPQGGIAEAHLRGRRTLPPASYRMLNGRILETALGFLNEDISAPFLAGLGKYRELATAAADTRANPQSETVVSLVDPYEINSTQQPYVALMVNDSEIARVTFEITLAFGMFATAVAVRRGAIESVDCEACSLKVTLKLVGWDPELITKEVHLRVRLPVNPPMRIPLP